MTERTTVRLPSDLLQRARHKAGREGRTLSSLIEDGLRWVVAQDLVSPAAARSRLPSRSKPGINSGSSSGLLPGVDLEPEPADDARPD